MVIQGKEAQWADALPRDPLTKEELELLLKRRFEQDEYTTLRQLAMLGSRSASIITGLELTRSVVKEALQKLCPDRAAQITLMSILGATRFRAYAGGRPLPTRCGNCKVREDSFTHLLHCYSLVSLYKKGAQSVDILVTLAKRTKLLIPGTSLPFVRDL